MSMENTIKVSLCPTTKDDELYLRYPVQTSRQPVHLTLDVEEGTLSAAAWGEIGPSQSMRSFHGRDVEWDIPPLRVAALTQLMESIRDDCQLICDHTDIIWDGSNYVGQADDVAREAAERVEDACERHGSWDVADVYEPWSPSDWFQTSPLDDIEEFTLECTDEELAELAQEEVDAADAVLDADEVTAYFIKVRDEAREEFVEDLDEEDITELRAEALAAGDESQVALCDQALAGDILGQLACAQAIAEAQVRVGEVYVGTWRDGVQDDGGDAY